MEKNYFPQLTVLSVANLLGETIWRVHDDCSVSSIFQWYGFSCRPIASLPYGLVVERFMSPLSFCQFLSLYPSPFSLYLQWLIASRPTPSTPPIIFLFLRLFFNRGFVVGFSKSNPSASPWSIQPKVSKTPITLPFLVHQHLKTTEMLQRWCFFSIFLPHSSFCCCLQYWPGAF